MNDLNNYEISWLDFTAEKISDYLDFVFSVDRQNFTRESVLFGYEKSDKVLRPNLDGTELEADRLASIAAYQSKGFNIIDITPGFLDLGTYPCNVQASWLYDAANFIPNDDGYLSLNFRSVDIQSPGNFLKIEFIQEINNQSNQSYAGRAVPSNFINTRDFSKPKYNEVFDNALTPQGLDIVNRVTTSGVVDQEPYHYDNFSRQLVWVSFNQTNQKPHLVKDGDIFNTYFDTVTIHCNIGAPKIRVTIGNNSTIIEGRGQEHFNSQLHLAGGSSLLKKIQGPLQPFVITDANIKGKSIQGQLSFIVGALSNFVQTPLVAPMGDFVQFGSNPAFINYGYSILWVTKMRVAYKLTATNLNTTGALLSTSLEVSSGILGVDPFSYSKIFACATPNMPTTVSVYSDTVELNFDTPVRIVIPAASQLNFRVDVKGFTQSTTVYPKFEIYGYALGGITQVSDGLGGVAFLQTTKFITDATFLDDYTFQYNENTYG